MSSTTVTIIVLCQDLTDPTTPFKYLHQRY